MNESGEKILPSHGREQMRDALHRQFTEAANAVFMTQLKSHDDRLAEDYALIQGHKDRLVAFLPKDMREMEEGFSERVQGLIKQCNEILDEEPFDFRNLGMHAAE